MKKTRTERGFGYIQFFDDNGVMCSLQESSAVPKIWLGCDDLNLRQGPPWRDYAVPDDVIGTTRMHLSRKQVKKLLPHLQKFVETGEI